MRKKLFTHLLLACLCLSLSAGSSVRVMAEEYEEEYKEYKPPRHQKKKR